MQKIHNAIKAARWRRFPISIERLDERATLLIHGKHSYRANVSDSPPGTIASLEHVLDSIEDRLRERETSLAQSRRQIVDLTNQLDQPFEREDKLAQATKRQQEIVTALDITKNQVANSLDINTDASNNTANAIGNGRTIS